MTSVLRAPSQIGAREKFLIGVRAFVSADTIPEDPLTAGFSEVASATVGNGGVYTSAEVQAFAGFFTDIAPIAVGDLFRDLGKELVLIGTDEKYLVRFRLARPVASATAEGIGPSNYNVWLKVWSADGTGVAVARTG